MSYHPEFVAKTEDPGDSSTLYEPVEIFSLSHLFTDEKEERALCPQSIQDLSEGFS